MNPLRIMSSNPSVVLSITEVSRPASKLVSDASEATAAVIVCCAPYFIKMSLGIV